MAAGSSGRVKQGEAGSANKFSRAVRVGFPRPKRRASAACRPDVGGRHSDMGIGPIRSRTAAILHRILVSVVLRRGGSGEDGNQREDPINCVRVG